MTSWPRTSVLGQVSNSKSNSQVHTAEDDTKVFQKPPQKSASFSCVKVRNVSSSRDAQVTAGDAAVAWLLSLKSALWAECRCPLSLSSLQGIKGLFLGAAAVAPHSVQFLLCTEEPVQRLDPCALSTPGTTTDRWTAGGVRVWACASEKQCVNTSLMLCHKFDRTSCWTSELGSSGQGPPHWRSRSRKRSPSK